MMTTITDEMMLDRLSKTKNYSLVILKPGANRKMEGADKIIWEHGRRNFTLREEGKLLIVCPVSDGKDVAGIGIFSGDLEEVKSIMDNDPAIKEKILDYDIYTCRGFPGDSLK